MIAHIPIVVTFEHHRRVTKIIKLLKPNTRLLKGKCKKFLKLL